MGDPRVIPLWYGESDVPTPAFINEAAARALAAGQTFYTHKRGIPELRAAIADYGSSLYGVPIEAERITVTSSGMSAIMLLRSEEHTSELQSLLRISYAVFCLT